MKSSVRTKLFFWCSAIAALISAVLIFRVNVNSDMTKYLPDSSPMKKGLDIMTSEFDASAMSIPDVKIMIRGLDRQEADSIALGMKSTEGVEDVRLSRKDGWTLFSLTVPKSVDQKALAEDLASQYGSADTVTRTSQDGNTPDPMALIIAVTALIIILFIMCRSWIEPLLLLLSCGMAVAVNVGTNAFLPSVSITTNSIVAVMQLILSIDYSIILLNRYRQIRLEVSDLDQALSGAMRSSVSSILSSALTTVVGLLMLCFMKLKIGADLGGILAKGVICSLVFTYTALPGLIRIFDRQIICKVKAVPSFNTDKLSKVIEKLSIPLGIAFVLIFAGSFILKDRTPMHFSTNVPSKIDEVFPPQNAIVLLYDNRDSLAVIDVLDEAARDSSVQMALSYSALMQRRLGAPEMVDFIRGLLDNEMVCGMMGEKPQEMDSFLTEDNLRILYYLANNNRELGITFPSLISFVDKEISENELFSQFGGDELADKISTLKMVMQAVRLDAPAATEHRSGHPGETTSGEALSGETPSGETPSGEPSSGEALSEEPSSGESIPAGESGVLSREAQTAPAEEPDTTLAQAPPSAEALAAKDTAPLPARDKFDDRELVNTPMDIDHLAEFIGSSTVQARMVFSLAKEQMMTPIAFARFLCNNLFNRKNLSAMVSARQKQQMRSILARMEAASVQPVRSDADSLALVTPPAADSVSFTADTVLSARIDAASREDAVPREEVSAPRSAAQGQEDSPERSASPEREVKSTEDLKLELLSELVNSPRALTSARMTETFHALGEDIAPGYTDLLYAVYGSKYSYDPSWKMTLEEIAASVSELVSEDVPGIFDAAGQLEAMRGSSHSIAAIVTTLPDESPRTEAFIKALERSADEKLEYDGCLVGESVMFCEMKDGFSSEMLLVTLLTILAIFTIVAITFRSALIALILVMTVMSAVFINVCVSGIGGGSMLYLANLIVQSILMGATIDYGILFTNYYRKSMSIAGGYRGAVPTIMTSGLIIVIVPGIMALLIDDAMISPIVRALSVGTFSAFVMIMFFLPAVLHACRKILRKQ